MPWKKQRKRKKGNIRLYLAITILCLIIAALFSFAIRYGGNIFEDRVKGTRPDALTMEKLKKAYGDKIDANELEEDKISLKEYKGIPDLERLKEDYKGKLNESEVERLKKVYQDMKRKNDN